MDENLFWLKKLLTWALYPLTLVIVGQLAGFLLVMFTSRKWLGRGMIAAAWLLLLACALPIVPHWLGQGLESSYHHLGEAQAIRRVYPQADQVRHVVVLGGGVYADTTVPAVGQLPRCALLRVMEGVRLHALFPKTNLILCGGSPMGTLIESEVMRRAALELGVSADAILTETGSRDTLDQVRAVKKIFGDEEFFLVTSAWHMRRSEGLARKHGLRPLVAPIDFITSSRSLSWFSLFTYLPSSQNIGGFEWTLKEWMGITWYRLTGKI